MWDPSSPTWDQTPVPCIARQIPNRCTPREAPSLHLGPGRSQGQLAPLKLAPQPRVCLPSRKRLEDFPSSGRKMRSMLSQQRAHVALRLNLPLGAEWESHRFPTGSENTQASSTPHPATCIHTAPSSSGPYFFLFYFIFSIEVWLLIGLFKC